MATDGFVNNNSVDCQGQAKVTRPLADWFSSAKFPPREATKFSYLKRGKKPAYHKMIRWKV